MPNAIQTVSKYLPYLDQVYSYASRSAILDTAGELVRETADAKTVLIAKTSMEGLGDYDRNGEKGFVNGNVSLTWESHTLTNDRGRSFQIDAMDDAETMGVAFGTLASEFLRTKVAPEIDAVRFSNYALKAGLTKTGTISKDNVIDEIDAAVTAMKENEVDLAGAVLFLTPTVYTAVKQSDKFSRPLTPGENPNRNFGMYDGELLIVEVPQSRFYKGVELADGKTSGQEAGGYEQAADGQEINFMIVTPAAVIQLTKHAKMRVFDPDTNQQADAYKIDYRIYHDAWVLDNKVKGIYAHTKA